MMNTTIWNMCAGPHSVRHFACASWVSEQPGGVRIVTNIWAQGSRKPKHMVVMKFDWFNWHGARSIPGHKASQEWTECEYPKAVLGLIILSSYQWEGEYRGSLECGSLLGQCLHLDCTQEFSKCGSPTTCLRITWGTISDPWQHRGSWLWIHEHSKQFRWWLGVCFL